MTDGERPVPPPATLRMCVHVVVEIRENPNDEPLTTSNGRVVMLAWTQLTTWLRRAGVDVDEALKTMPRPE